MTRAALMIIALCACWSPRPWGATAALAAVLWAVRRPRARWPAAVGVTLLALASQVGSAVVPPVPAGAVELVGVVRRPPRARAAALDVDGWRVELGEPVAPLPGPGTVLRVVGRVSASGRVTPVVCEPLGRVDGLHGAQLDRFAQTCRRRLARLVGRPARGLVEALVVGERGALPDPLRRAAVDGGTSHLLALSGLHVAIVASWLGRALPWLGVPRRLGTGAALAAFVAVAGARPPLLRAFTTWASATLAGACGRRSDALDRLGLAALVLVAWSPDVRDDLGARLSFCAVAGLVATARALPNRLSPLAPLGAFVATAPLCAETFGVLQPLGVAWSWVLGPLVALVMALGVVALAAPPVPWVDAWLGPALTGAAEVLAGGFRLTAELSPAACRPGPLPVSGWVASLVVVGLLVGFAPRRRARWEDVP